MRDILVTLLVFGSLPLILKRPYVGVLVWSWLSYMNPHRLAWGFAYNMPFAQIVAVTLLFSVLISKQPKNLPASGTLGIWIAFIVWMGITTIFAIYPQYATEELIRVIKIQLVTFLTLMLMRDQEKIDMLIWVIAISIGYYSIKGGFFTLITGGGFRVWGPPGSFIEENNALALATLMIVPLMVYLYQINTKKWIRYGLGVSIFLSLFSAVGSQSRGALLAIIAVSGFFWLKTKNKLVTGFAIVLLSILGIALMPESWTERMVSIKNYQEDESAMGRIDAWVYSINLANDRLTGGGFNSWSKNNYAIYNPDSVARVVAHSVYFSVLADHGWVGLALFLLILFCTWRSLSKVIRMTKNIEEFKSQNILARMMQVCLVAYMSGGAFLSLSYFDLPWHIISLSLLMKHQVDSKVKSNNLKILSTKNSFS